MEFIWIKVGFGPRQDTFSPDDFRQSLW